MIEVISIANNDACFSIIVAKIDKEYTGLLQSI